jgi:hypothetical protein
MRAPRSVIRLFFGLSGWGTVPGAFFRSKATGDQVPLRYWTQNPTLSKVERDEAIRERRIGLASTLVAVLAALRPGWRAWRTAAKAVWMVRNGPRTQAGILDHAQTASTKMSRSGAPDGLRPTAPRGHRRAAGSPRFSQSVAT